MKTKRRQWGILIIISGLALLFHRHNEKIVQNLSTNKIFGKYLQIAFMQVFMNVWCKFPNILAYIVTRCGKSSLCVGLKDSQIYSDRNF